MHNLKLSPTVCRKAGCTFTLEDSTYIQTALTIVMHYFLAGPIQHVCN